MISRIASLITLSIISITSLMAQNQVELASKWEKGEEKFFIYDEVNDVSTEDGTRKVYLTTSSDRATFKIGATPYVGNFEKNASGESVMQYFMNYREREQKMFLIDDRMVFFEGDLESGNITITGGLRKPASNKDKATILEGINMYLADPEKGQQVANNKLTSSWEALESYDLSMRDQQIAKYKASQKSSLPIKEDKSLHKFKVLNVQSTAFESFRQLGILENDEGFVTINAYAKNWDKFDEDDTHSRNFQINEFGLVLAQHDETGKLVKWGTILPYNDIPNGAWITKFEKTDFGYFASGPRGMYWFDNDFKVTNTYANPSQTSAMVQATPIGNTGNVAVMWQYSTNELSLNIFNNETDTWLFDEEVPLISSGGMIPADETNTKALFHLDDNTLLVAYAAYDEDLNVSQFIEKFDLRKLLNNDQDNAMIFRVRYGGYIMRYLNLEEDGRIHGINQVKDDKIHDANDFAFFKLDPYQRTRQDFLKSIDYHVVEPLDSPLEKITYAKKCGKYYAVLGKGSGYWGVPVSCVAFYNFEWELVGLHYMSLGERDKDVFFTSHELWPNGGIYQFTYQYGGGNEMARSRMAGSVYNSIGGDFFCTWGPDQIFWGDIDEGERDYFRNSYADRDGEVNEVGNCHWVVDNFNFCFDIAAKGNGEFLILDKRSIKTVSILGTEVCEFKRKPEEPRYINSAAQYDSDDDDDDYTDYSNDQSDQQDNTAIVESNTDQDTGPKYSGSVYFKHDYSGSDASTTRKKIYIHYGSNGSSTTSTTRGSSCTVKCEAYKVYYSFTGKKSDMQLIQMLSTDDCGKTIKTSSFL